MRRARIVTLMTMTMSMAGTGLLVSAGLAASASAITAAVPPHGTMTTIAGGTGGPAAATSVSVSPCAIKYAGGSLYISTGGSYTQAVYRVSERTGLLTLVAGSGLYGGNEIQQPARGVPASAFTFDSPCGTTVDGAGNVLVADFDQTLAVAAKTGTFYGRPMTAGRVYTISAWSGEYGTQEVQLDSAGNLVMAENGEGASHTNDETYAQVIVKAERTGAFYGRRMVKGKLYTVAGLPRGGAHVPPGSYQRGRSATASRATARSAAARTATAAGVPATQDDLGYEIGALRCDAAGNIVIADPGGNGFGAIGRGSDVSPSVQVIPLRSGTFYHRAMKAGYAYTLAGHGDKDPNGVPAAASALDSAGGVALDHAGNVLIADSALRVIAARTGTFYGRRMTAGDIYTLAKLPGSQPPQFPGPETVAVDDAGNVLFGGSAASRVYLLAGKSGRFYGQRVRAGRVYPVAGNGRLDYSGDGGPATRAELIDPYAIAVNQTGTLTAITDSEQFAVRVIAHAAGRHFGRALRAGDIYTAAGGGTGTSAASGVPGASVKLYPDGTAFDRPGNLVVSDGINHRIHVVANSSGVYYGQKMTSGDIYTVAGSGTGGFSGDGGPARAASLAGPRGVAVDRAGNVLLIDSDNYSTDRIRVVAASAGTFYGQPMTAGDIYTVAGAGAPGYSGDGGPATAAQIQPQGIAADVGGNLVIADGRRVRVVAARTGPLYGRAMTAGSIYTVAGGGTQAAGGTPALRARLTASAVAVDQAGNLLIGEADTVNVSTVVMVAEKTGTYYGQAMRAGDVYPVARSAGGSVFVDDVPATRAAFTAAGIAVQPGTENLLIADSSAHRIRSVSR